MATLPTGGLSLEESARRSEGLLTDLLDPMTHRIGVYVFLAFPLGLVTLLLLSAGVLLGILLLPVLVGAPLLLGSLWLLGSFSELQRRMAGFLGLSFAPPLFTPAYSSLMAWLRATLASPETYRMMLFQVVQVPLALLCWLVVGGLLGVGLAGLTAPLWTPLRLDALWNLLGLEGVQFKPTASLWLMVVGLGTFLVLAGVLHLMGRIWRRLAAALLSRNNPEEVARREVMALRQAAGRVALGEDLPSTLQALMEQARLGSSARTVALLDPSGQVRAVSGPDELVGPFSGGLPTSPEVIELGGATLPAQAQIPVMLAGAPVPVAAMRAFYSHGLRPSPDELAFLLSIGDHVGTALQAAQLIERASSKASEQERARLARELHDSVAQALYGISLGAKTARATLGQDQAKTEASLEYTIKLAEGGVSEMKALLFSLRPDALEEGGLLAALAQQAHALETRYGLEVQTRWEGEPPLSAQAQAGAYRVIQEALHNVVKHARARRVQLDVVHDLERVTVTIEDDGQGFVVDQLRPGRLGQRSMRERAQELGGQLEVQSHPGRGTRVTLVLPVASRSRAEA